jgi:hypothetical protein
MVTQELYPERDIFSSLPKLDYLWKRDLVKGVVNRKYFLYFLAFYNMSGTSFLSVFGIGVCVACPSTKYICSRRYRLTLLEKHFYGSRYCRRCCNRQIYKTRICLIRCHHYNNNSSNKNSCQDHDIQQVTQKDEAATTTHIVNNNNDIGNSFVVTKGDVPFLLLMENHRATSSLAIPLEATLSINKAVLSFTIVGSP